MESCELERMAALLQSSGRYRILRRLEQPSVYNVPDGTPTRRAVFLDLETTGLDPATDEIIEMAMVPFDFSSDGRIFSVHEPFSRFRDPGRPIPAEVVAITGITDDMVAGSSIDAADIEAFLGEAVVVIAHNAGFDRRLAERFCGAFAHLPWACSWSEIPWAEEGFTDGAKLGQLAAAYGFFHATPVWRSCPAHYRAAGAAASTCCSDPRGRRDGGSAPWERRSNSADP
jgi:DNA polymerase III subunit epsilon